ncbi:calcineurin-like phosphoesterase family protein [Synechococcus sp. RS9909]|uniref:metallophosphoesterase family protein n=1 Tax=unclassified Synechococcus TaxID=2626047 RepID=UPI000068F97A|nr:serine/threonine specific protein phosphatase [Synechococcus sp. RS9917]QNI80410.1 calcineurin-like phosphoesterase family protein [Synechococcus sp. RS9909]
MPLRRRQLLQLAAAGAGSGAWWLLGQQQQPATAAPNRTPDLRLGLISDLNASYGSSSYIPQVNQGLRQLLALQPALVVCAGDMVAGQKRGLSAGQLDGMWEGFARTVLAPIRQAGLPFLPAVGNHDGSPGFEADRAAVRRFWTPRRQALGLRFVDAGDFPFHYSALQSDVFWLVWDASASRIPASQLSWARQQLTSPEARQARLRLVVGHLPLVGVSQGRDRAGETLDQAAAVQSLLEQGRVQAYISGHQHAWFPARRGQLDLIHLGAMGSGPRRLLQGNIPPQQTYTTLDIHWGNSSLVETTYAVTSGQPVAWSRLPATLMGRAGGLNRNVQVRSIRR